MSRLILTFFSKKVADLYNARYRQGKESQYGPENVCICPGGRAALTRIAACVGDVNVGYFLPGKELHLFITDMIF